MKTDARIHSGDEKLVRPELGDERGAVGISVARRPPAVVLRITIRHGCLPCAKIQLLLRLAGFLHRGLELALEVQLGDLPDHGSKQPEYPCMSRRGTVAEDVPAPGINPEWRHAHGAFAKDQEIVFCK